MFYDGTWFDYFWQFMADHSEWQASPSFPGIHDALRWYVHREFGVYLDEIVVSEAHFVLGRFVGSGTESAPALRIASARWDLVLKKSGIVRHSVVYDGNKESGADVALSLAAYSAATSRAVDVVVLVTGDSDYLPLIDRLRSMGVPVVIPQISSERVATTARTAAFLVKAADRAPKWEDLFSAALDPAYPLMYPFNIPIAGTMGSPRAADGYRYGTVQRWEHFQNHGFIRDKHGTAWFVGVADLPPGLKRLPVGQAVRFNGVDRIPQGWKYRQAHAVVPVDGSGAEGLPGQ
ncbi:NYN domain-containing protein [Sphaerisporangium sp. NPDC051011]|uniref:NYN domain-containing protein n=1 Tax=Sphaerisporangium sp. NPDC051011 TaxID=3155792 RepID=UPI0033DA6A32